jgi:NTP pyrophosphatase (non-canonical NTP hydrolase)
MDPSHVIAINQVSAEVYKIAADHGFHPDAVTEATDLGRLAKFCANLHGEISELWEAARKGTLFKSCDKDGCPLTCAEEELADIIIRAMDTAIALDIDLGMAICTKSLYNKTRPHMHGKLA